MNTNGMSQVGTFTQDNLIAGNRHPVDVVHVVIKAGQNLKRGTVLEEDVEESGKYVIRGTRDAVAAANGSEESEEDAKTSEGVREVEAEYILAEDADASEGDVTGTAYYTGEFAENALIVKDGYELTDRDRRMLRNAGIFLRTIMM